jgi:hypothetical protein
MRRTVATFTCLALFACGASTTPPAVATSSTLVQPARNIHLRVSFDDDPTTYLGRFIPDNVAETEVDDSNAVVTRCSQFIKAKVVTSNQEMDEVMYASRKASGALGVAMVAKVSASHEDSNALRVKYVIAKKMQSDVDAAGLDRCCHDQPDQCSKRYIGEFVMGSGQVYQQAGNDTQGSAGGSTHGVAADVEIKDSVAWKRVSIFKDTYFAFQSGSGMGQLAAAVPVSTGAGADDCGWCDTLPSSLDGKFFCGVSPDAPSETMSRDYAMRNAREQVIKYMGEYLSSRSKTQASLLKGYADDVQLISAGAEGLASRVKDQKWCKAQTSNTPDGLRYRTRVLAFLPNDQLEGAAKDAVETLINKRRAANAITPDQEKALRAIVR